jgi:hypothetical protein
MFLRSLQALRGACFGCVSLCGGTVGELTIAGLLGAFLVDLVAIVILAYVLHFRRYGRRALLVSYSAVNISLFVVAAALASTDPIGVGVGFGLFAVLSIIRLRSDEATPTETGYMMVALVLGLLNGLPGINLEMKVLLSGLLLGAMYVIDHPSLLGRNQYHRITVTLDRAYRDRDLMIAEIERRLGGTVKHVDVRDVDFVRETTLVDTRLVTPPRNQLKDGD